MKATEILDELEALFKEPFDPSEFAFAFIDCFPKSKTTLARLRKGSTNKSDIDGAVLQRNAIHIYACPLGTVEASLAALRESPQTTKQKAKFILASDGDTLQAENLATGDVIACDYPDLPDKHFGFLLPLAGISTNNEIRDNPVDIKATNRLDKLYQALASANPDWTTLERREDFNHFMAQLIFCFYAEDTSIFRIPGHGLVSGDGIEGAGERKSSYAGLFTETVREMTAGDGSDTREVIRDIFHAMNLDTRDGKGASRIEAGLKNWADQFPYVNGRLFESKTEGGAPAVPHFTQMARSYLIAAGELKWTDINPDIFGSMIQNVTDEEDRGTQHYTSVPNILKVLNPLFLDSLRDQLAKAGTNPQQLGKFKKRLAHIRVFDPACGSGNFLVIAYKRMRELEHIANILGGRAERREGDDQPGGKEGQTRVCALWEAEIRGGEGTRDALEAELRQWNGETSVIPLTNFRGIEIKSFAAEVARLALVIAEYQCDTLFLGQQRADALFLPLNQQNWIFKENALRLDWLKVCPPAGETKVSAKLTEDDLFKTPLKQTEIDFENEGGETYICGNPPFRGVRKQTREEKEDARRVLSDVSSRWASIDYVGCWLVKAEEYLRVAHGQAVFVATNSLCQGQQVSALWKYLFEKGLSIDFAYRSFKWSNLASNSAGVTVVIVGVSRTGVLPKRIFEGKKVFNTNYINPYLTDHNVVAVSPERTPINDLTELEYGVYYSKSGPLILTRRESDDLVRQGLPRANVRAFVGSSEVIKGKEKFCLWLSDEDLQAATKIEAVQRRIDDTRKERLSSRDKSMNKLASRPHQFRERKGDENSKLIVPIVSSEDRDVLPVTLAHSRVVPTNKNFFMPNPELWNMALIASRLHWVWIGTVCVRLEMRFSYSNTLGWNTFPVHEDVFMDEHKKTLTRAAENILLAREAHFPATIADLYKPDAMPEDLRAAHAENDRILEEIYIGRPFRNDTERLEKLFEMYAEMVKGEAA